MNIRNPQAQRRTEILSLAFKTESEENCESETEGQADVRLSGRMQSKV